MDSTMLIVLSGSAIGAGLFVTLAVMRYRETKTLQDKNSQQDAKDARAIDRWAAKESRRPK